LTMSEESKTLWKETQDAGFTQLFLSRFGIRFESFGWISIGTSASELRHDRQLTALVHVLRKVSHLIEKIEIWTAVGGVLVAVSAALSQCRDLTWCALKELHLPLAYPDNNMANITKCLPADIEVRVESPHCSTCALYGYHNLAVSHLHVMGPIAFEPHDRMGKWLKFNAAIRQVTVRDTLESGPVALLKEHTATLRRLIDCAKEDHSSLEKITVITPNGPVDVLEYASQPHEGIPDTFPARNRLIQAKCLARRFRRVALPLAPFAMAGLRSNTGNALRDSLMRPEILGPIVQMSGLTSPADAPGGEAGFNRFATGLASLLGRFMSTSYAQAASAPIVVEPRRSSRKRKLERVD